MNILYNIVSFSSSFQMMTTITKKKKIDMRLPPFEFILVRFSLLLCFVVVWQQRVAVVGVEAGGGGGGPFHRPPHQASFVADARTRRRRRTGAVATTADRVSAIAGYRHRSRPASTSPSYFSSPRYFSRREDDNENSSLSIYWSGSNNSSRSKKRQQLDLDVVIVGAGLAGLSAALHLSQMDPSRTVTILDRVDAKKAVRGPRGESAAGSFAAAGMLAPQSERLPAGPLLDLCLESRRMYPEFCELVERLASEEYSSSSAAAGEEDEDDGRAYFRRSNDDKDEDRPWNVGYMATGGFLAPAYAGDAVATWAPPEDSGSAKWLDAMQVRELEPNLHPDVVGGWWFPEDASVDALRLTCSLRAACVRAGVQILSGPEYEISSLDLHDKACRGLWIRKGGGQYVSAKAVLVANGAWMRDLLPVPIEPHKGQSLSLRMPENQPPILRRVLFAQDSYIVPKADGTIVIGATVEAGSYDPNVTPAGMIHILTHALQLLPGLKDLPIVESWAGLRPTTPDKGPILGKTLWDNLYLAGGYWRNGVLLAPKTGQLLATLISGQPLSPEDSDLLDAFSWDRFTDASKGASLAANSRYAASMHPIHRRTSGFGVAASVGTELGSYSSARSAAEERQRDRNALWNAGDDDALERAAELGKLDSTAFVLGKDDNEDDDSPEDAVGNDALWPDKHAVPFEGSVDALTVGSATSKAGDESPSDARAASNLDDVYEKIRKNKAKQGLQLDESSKNRDERPDPGFRIYHVDAETGERREVPPYTAPGDFLKSIEESKTTNTMQAPVEGVSVAGDDAGTAAEESVESSSYPYSEKTYDGYQDIQQANARATREEELETMRAARRKNRLGQTSIDQSKIGAVPADATPSENVINNNSVNDSNGLPNSFSIPK